MKDIVIVGAGGLGREVASLLKRINKVEPIWNLLGFYDDDQESKPRGSKNEYGEILGTIDDLNKTAVLVYVIIAIGSPKALRKIRERLNNPFILFPNIIAPEASILDSDNYEMGEGNIISSFASISCHVKMGSFNVLNNRVSFGHDAQIGDYNVFMTASRISGDTEIHTGNLFGVASIVIPGVRVGEGVILSPGSVLVRKPKDNSTYIGNPAKLFNF
ncbi:serine acetyltransferase [Bacteroides faecichinchillae]|uniref:PglD-related sugar-binding protein n=1 Tax=Bacteroides faecichinchillae TaxID=871325 RepID=UPI003514480D